MKSTTVEPARKTSGGAATLAPPEEQRKSAATSDGPEAEHDDESGFDWDVLSLLKPFGEAPAWVISLSIHLVFLMVLSTFVIEQSPLRDFIAIDSSIDTQRPDPTFDAVVT
ncbi:MAG TPA: hypothetical protein VHB77_04530, partial [Planctomycetaceae bacterium]|nr:hypothetical protein [Planctomycetaceae bacterium]